MKRSNERGSYTLEAMISLVAFLVVIMAAYSYVKTMIAETIMQRAVSNMSAQISSYVYILDRAGLIISHKSNEFDDLNNTVKKGEELIGQGMQTYENISACTNGNLDQMTELVGTLFGDGDGSMKGTVSSFKDFISVAKQVDWKNAAKNSGRLALEDLVKSGANSALSNLYNNMLDEFLPMDRDSFCKAFNIDKNSISFKYSAIFPTTDNNSVFVAVEYSVLPKYRIPGMTPRKTIKCALNAAWVSSNANGSGVKSGG